MVSKDELLAVLPVREEVILSTEDRQNTDDIRREILQAHKEFRADYDLIARYFDTGDITDTSREIFDFLKYNVPYRKENGRFQTIKNPRAILTLNDGKTNYDRVDCKNYAGFIAGILDSLKRNGATGWKWCYRFASYNERDPEPGHVFVVVKVDDSELWIDPVFPFFNAGTMHEWELDETPSIGGLYKVIAGTNDTVSNDRVIVNTNEAGKNFVIAVRMNLFALPTLMLQNPQITNSPGLQQVLKESGVDLNGLAAMLAYWSKQGL